MPALLIQMSMPPSCAEAVSQSKVPAAFSPALISLFNLFGITLPTTIAPLGHVAYGVNSEASAELSEAINRDESRILAQGTIAITARYLNVNGLIQSGVDTISLNIDAKFNPGSRTVNFTDSKGNTLNGISFGDDVPVDGYFDPSGANGRGAIVVEDIMTVARRKFKRDKNIDVTFEGYKLPKRILDKSR